MLHSECWRRSAAAAPLRASIWALTLPCFVLNGVPCQPRDVHALTSRSQRPSSSAARCVHRFGNRMPWMRAITGGTARQQGSESVMKDCTRQDGHSPDIHSAERVQHDGRDSKQAAITSLAGTAHPRSRMAAAGLLAGIPTVRPARAPGDGHVDVQMKTNSADEPVVADSCCLGAVLLLEDECRALLQLEHWERAAALAADDVRKHPSRPRGA